MSTDIVPAEDDLDWSGDGEHTWLVFNACTDVDTSRPDWIPYHSTLPEQRSRGVVQWLPGGVPAEIGARA